MPGQYQDDGVPHHDRLLHHVHIVHIDGRSYRLREIDGLLAPQPDTSPPAKGGEQHTT
ncbi:MAG: hypothetical protein RQ745_13035 [Longimicrobiales bacterium]|nr:hypothetical protein [Longimicrobiales bacterium]